MTLDYNIEQYYGHVQVLRNDRKGKSMGRNDFKDDEKIEAFEDIAVQYYYRNFGSLTKTDFETLLFKIYLRHLKRNQLSMDDYSISRDLGITQSKVRNMKLRIDLRDSDRHSDSWVEEFAACVGTAIYDDNKKLVKVMVPEVTVMMELRHFMEENRWYDEYQLNPKLFQCPLNFFLPLCEKISGTDLVLDDTAKKKIEELRDTANEKEQSAILKILNGAIEKGFKDLAWTGTTAIIVEVLKVLPFGGVASTIISALIAVLSQSGGLNVLSSSDSAGGSN